MFSIAYINQGNVINGFKFLFSVSVIVFTEILIFIITKIILYIK